MSSTAEQAMWGDPAATDRVEEYEADSVDDHGLVGSLVSEAINQLVSYAHNLDVTMCDAGTIEDILALLETMKPHPVDKIRQRAREVAWDRENV